MIVVAHFMGFYGGVRRRPGDKFEVPDGTKSKWFAPIGEKLTSGLKAPALPGPAAAPKAPADEQGQTPKPLEDMKAGELVAFAKANNLDIGGLQPQAGKEKVLAAVKAAMAPKAPADEQGPGDEGRASDQVLI